ncbi:MAG: phosphoribosylformylglycinamidine synthase subunit PurQ [Leptospirales bacterium]|nr:phosphoribosylformylglycinamidine synthase subunit PurQ [Leptospirales bacterium]HMW60113.1 phosphoribosylformylglycinamidine synthase subunit PurQ [Leptospiraceae bacterium]
MKAGVVTFPGSNCDQDMILVLRQFFGATVESLWHADQFQGSFDLIVIPGGFSYGDYLRTGAIARFAPAMKSVAEHAKRGGVTIGICNGFQILCEAGLLPGALIRNVTLKHICKDVQLRAKVNPFTRGLTPNQIVTLPVSHGDGNYRADDDVIRSLFDNDQVAFEYVQNVNGAEKNIAGISDKSGRVLGMMPHPERAVDPATGGTDGKAVLESILNVCRAHV